MREIKFRAWSLIGEPSMLFLTEGLISDLKTIQNQWHVMQYTGLKDNNGVEIYEGDILKHNYENYEGKVWFSNGCFLTDCAGFGDQAINELDTGWIEVIGNIYENPELIGEKT